MNIDYKVDLSQEEQAVRNNYDNLIINRETDAYVAYVERMRNQSSPTLILTLGEFLAELEDQTKDYEIQGNPFVNECMYEEDKRWQQFGFPNPWLPHRRRYYEGRERGSDGGNDIAAAQAAARRLANIPRP